MALDTRYVNEINIAGEPKKLGGDELVLVAVPPSVYRASLSDFKAYIYAYGETWEDLRFPASGINPQGQASPPDQDSTNGGLLFGASGEEVVSVIAQLPHSWAEGTPLIPHVHWQKTTSASGNVLWKFEYRWAPIGAVWEDAASVMTSETVAGTPDNDIAGEHMISSFGSLDASGKTISDMLVMKVSRVGGDVADTYGADARLLEFDIHYQRDAPGSLQEFIK